MWCAKFINAFCDNKIHTKITAAISKWLDTSRGPRRQWAVFMANRSETFRK